MQEPQELNAVADPTCFWLNQSSTERNSRAGFPTAIILGAISFVTTDPAPMTAPSPIVTPGRIMAPAPIQA